MICIPKDEEVALVLDLVVEHRSVVPSHYGFLTLDIPLDQFSV